MQMAVNHLGHFLLTNLLKDSMNLDARIVNLSSIAYSQIECIDFKDVNYEKSIYNPFLAYKRSKLANLLFTRELAKRLESSMSTYAVHPGHVRTNLGHVAMKHLKLPFTILYVLSPFKRTFLATSPKLGAQTTLYCCLEKGLTSGGYYE